VVLTELHLTLIHTGVRDLINISLKVLFIERALGRDIPGRVVREARGGGAVVSSETTPQSNSVE
jgi:hypothetical protein